MGNISKVITEQEVLHRQSYMPIHTYIAHIIPYLEQRQQAARRFYDIKGKSPETDEQLSRLIEWNNNEIMQLLDIPPVNNQS